jgi:trimethyllysine dioxygenase
MPTITDLRSEPSALVVVWDDGVTTTYPWLWLRDHSRDPVTLNPATLQREVHTAGLPRDLAATDVVRSDDDVIVRWPGDDLDSVLPVAFLADFRTPVPAAARLAVEKVLWDAEMILPTPSTPYDAIMGSDEGLRDWLTQVAAYGFALATGVPATTEATEGLIRRVAYVRESIFGGFWSFTADQSKADSAYTNIELLAHNDGTYSHDAPGLQLLHCLHFEGTGGESTMSDGFRVAAELKEQSPQLYDVLSSVVVPGEYQGDGAHLRAARPMLRHDHTGALVQVSFNNNDRAPFLLDPDQMVAWYDALREFDALANSRRLQWRHGLRPGEAMLFDNWRALHGRAAYTGSRTLCGAYLNHEDFEGRLRLLGAG